MKSRSSSLGTMPRSAFSSSSLSIWLSFNLTEYDTRRSFAEAFATDGNAGSTLLGSGRGGP